MDVGKVYALSEEGKNKLREMMQLAIDSNTRVTVIGGKRVCSKSCGGGSRPTHTDDCGSRYQWMKVNDIDETEVLLSAEDVQEV